MSLPREINRIYKMWLMCNRTWQKLYFAKILDLEYQRTPLTTLWVTHFWNQMFRVVLRTGLCIHVGSHSETGRGHSKWAKFPRQVRCQPFYFILYKPERAQCSKYHNCPLTYPCLSLGLWFGLCFCCLFLHKHLSVAFDSFKTALYCIPCTAAKAKGIMCPSV